MTRNTICAAAIAVVITAALWADAQPRTTTDDAPIRPIQSGDIITIPIGETVLSAPITVTHGQNVRIVGSGSGQSILTYAGAPGGCAIDFVSCYGCTVTGVDFRTNSPNATAIRYRTVGDTSGKFHPTRNVIDDCRFDAGKHQWKRCVDVDSYVSPGRDNNQDFYRINRAAFFSYTDCGLRINGSQAKGWQIDQCEFYGRGVAPVGLHLEMAGSGLINNCYFNQHTFASIHGQSLWGNDTIIINGGTTEATSGESFIVVGTGGYAFPMTVTGYSWRGKMPTNRGIIEYGKAGHLTLMGCEFWISDGYTGQSIIRCYEQPGTGAGSVSVRGCEFATNHPQPIPRQSILSAPRSWSADWFGVTARSLSPPGPWHNDPNKNPHRSHNVSAAEGRAP